MYAQQTMGAGTFAWTQFPAQPWTGAPGLPTTTAPQARIRGFLVDGSRGQQLYDPSSQPYPTTCQLPQWNLPRPAGPGASSTQPASSSIIYIIGTGSGALKLRGM